MQILSRLISLILFSTTSKYIKVSYFSEMDLKVMDWGLIRQLSEEEFRRLTGVKKHTFDKMVG
ncbi:TPA: hypothetical protein ACPHY4_003804, partial [Legionella anisa]